MQRDRTAPRGAVASRLIVRAAVVCAVALWGGGCAARLPAFPSGPGEPLANPQAVLGAITSVCGSVRTLVADLSLSGRSSNGRLRGRVQAGFRAPDALRLEGLAPFGAPYFVLVAGPVATTVLLPREDRVHQGSSPAHVVEALSGIAIDPAGLRAVLTGCITADLNARDGGRLSNDRLIIRTADGSTLLARQGRIVAGLRDGLRIDYPAFEGNFPSLIRLTAVQGAPPLDATVRVSALETNRELSDEVFTVVVPAEARPMTLEELRRMGPLGEAR